MFVATGRAAAFAAFLIGGILAAALPAAADDVTLLSREGNIEISGRLQGYDGEFYRVATRYGLLTVDGQGVICEGPACPELIAPKAEIRLVGAADPGQRLLPALFRNFAQNRGLIYQELPAQDGATWAAVLLDPDGRKPLADLRFTPMSPEAAAQARADDRAEFEVSARKVADGGALRPMAMDALLPVMAPGNPTPKVSTPLLAKALAGEITNWAELGGPDMPIVLHGLDPATDLAMALDQRLGAAVKAQVLHPDMASLAKAVAEDPWALAMTARAEVSPAVVLPLVDSCGFPLLPRAISVKAEDYPLAMPIHLISAQRRIPLLAREFLEFLATPAADQAVASVGYIDRAAERTPMTQDGLRLLNAIRGAGEDVTLEDLKHLAGVMEGAERLSLTFRFEEGTAVLDPSSRENLAQLARLIAAETFPAQQLILAGFSDGTGRPATNRALSEERALRVVEDLQALAPDLRPDQLPKVEGFGEALPMACDETVIGRRLNRRVELWVTPNFTPAPL